MCSAAMRLISFSRRGSVSRLPSSIGVEVGKEVVDLTQSTGFKDMKTFLEQDNYLQLAEDAVNSNGSRLSLADVVIRAPLYTPEKILCVGLNYKDHALESGMPIPSEPLFFSKFSSAIVGPGDLVKKPQETSQLDYEVELVVVIGKTGTRIPRAKAFEHIAGYTVGNFLSA